jgi:polyferredoxin
VAGLAQTRSRRRKSIPVAIARRLVQGGFVALAVYVGARHLWAGSESAGTASFDATCPFGGIETLLQLATGGTLLRKLHPSNLVMLAATLATALVMGRAFCGWICPLGTIQEWLARAVHKVTGDRKAWLPLRVPPVLDRPLRLVKYGILGLVIWGSASAVVPPLEPFCPYKTLFHFELGSALAWSVLLTMIVGSVLVERFWCKYLCPLGAILSLSNRIAPLRVRTGSSCVDCGRCGKTCAMGIEERPENIRSPECIRCLDCLDSCKRPGAIELRLG